MVGLKDIADVLAAEMVAGGFGEVGEIVVFRCRGCIR